MKALSFTVAELAALGPEKLPAEFKNDTHLIYSSPATLAFNSPGAEGFGVKRAGLSIPGSVMLIISPGCCGRNTGEITRIPGYENRFFYLLMDETDLVTGRHLRKIPEAVQEIVDFLPEKPSVVMLCITCVDALLGTDMERVSRKAEEAAGVRVRPCYMYALTREGRKPPMVHVRESLYSLVEKQKKRGSTVNLLGFFAQLQDDFELYEMLRGIGVKQINEMGRCETYSDFQRFGEANFSLVLNREAVPAAMDMEKRLAIPFILLARFYDIDAVQRQYQALAQALNLPLETDLGYARAKVAIEKLKKAYPSLRFNVGESMNGNPFEMSAALVKYGFRVGEIYGNPTAEDFRYLQFLAEKSPETRVLSNMEPTMLYYDSSTCPCDVTLGKDAAFYQPQAKHVRFSEDEQPYGYAGIRRLMEEILEGVK